MSHTQLSRRALLAAGAASAAVLVTGCGQDRRVTGDPRAPKWERPGVTPGVGTWYTVVAGDELQALCQRFAVPVGDVVAVNSLRSLTVQPGQRLWLPGVGDSVAATAKPSGPAPHTQPAAPVQEVPGQGYVLVPRAAWTDEPVARNNNPMGKVQRITIHHTGEHIGLKGLPDIEVIRRIERYHRNPAPNGRGWAAIGYHYLVGKDGRVYEGRPAKYQGAHVSGANENNLGISVIGDFSHSKPSPRQLAALTAFINDQRAHYKVPAKRVFGHRDVGRSECPGDALYAWLGSQGYTKQA
jgi:LysM repeat protein